MSALDLHCFPDATSLAHHAADLWLQRVSNGAGPTSVFTVALSGGRISKTFFSAFTRLATERKARLDHVHFFWADERCLPPDDPESNFRMAEELLFAPLRIRSSHIHRLRGELPPAEAVACASEALRAVASMQANGQPVLDLVVLGMGEDGHIASLFPNAPEEVLTAIGPFLFVPDSPKPPPRRLSLSYRTIAAAREIWVLASGTGKEAALAESLRADGRTPLANLARLRPGVQLFTDISPAGR